MPSVNDVFSVVSQLVGRSVARPPGTLSGHAAGLPFEKLVHNALLPAYPGQCYRHFEILNVVFGSNEDVLMEKHRIELLGPPALQLLLRRGSQATKTWSVSQQFKEKQNDTAETVILPRRGRTIEPLPGEPVVLLDVKTQTTSVAGQPPNIISARKVMNACKLVLQHSEESPFDLIYIGIKWYEQNNRLVCERVSAKSLFKIRPAEIYVNWAAATQIQFHPDTVGQNFSGSTLDWCMEFLDSYLKQLERKLEKDNKDLKELRTFLKSRP